MKTILSSLALVTAILSPLVASADSLKEAATKVFSERKANVVRLTVARKVGEKDVVFEVAALSFDGKGLLVTALGRLEGGSKKGELVRVAMFQEDGSEVEGDLVLTDPELDLAFVKLRPAEEGADAITIPAAAPIAEGVALLDDAIGITRYGAGFQREASVSLVEIAAVVETPRKLFLPSAQLPEGSAAFNTKGELIGIMARVERQPVIVPAAAVQKLAGTIGEKKADDVKKAPVTEKSAAE